MLDEKGYLACSLNNKGVQNYDAFNRLGPIYNRCMEVTAYAVLSKSTFYDRYHDVFALFLF